MEENTKTRAELIEELNMLRNEVERLKSRQAEFDRPSAVNQQNQLQILLDSIPSYIYYKNNDGKYVIVNKALAAALGVPREKWCGKTFYELFPGYSTSHLTDDTEVLKNGKPKRNIEQLLQTPEGIRWTQTDKIPFIDENGAVQGVVSISTDITERKESEAALRVSETKYKIIAENTYDWEFWVSPEGNFIYSSPSCKRISGYEACEFEDNPRLFESIIHPDDLSGYKDHINEKGSYTEQKEITFRIITKNGEDRWITHLCQPAIGPEGIILGRRGSNRDITERKLAEIALRISEKRYRILAENFPNGAVILFDKEFRYIVADGSELGKAGLLRENTEGRTIWEIYPREMCSILEPYYCAALNGEKNIFTIPLADRIFEFHTLPIKEEDGRVSAGMCLILDITEKKNYENELKALNAGKDKLFSIIAHDLKSPFTALLGFSEYLANYLEDLSPEEIKDFAFSIHKSASGVFKLIENLLQWSRLQLGRMDYAPVKFNLNDLADETVQLYQANSVKKKIRLEMNLENGLYAFADKQMAETVLRNLISNALKFTETGGSVLLSASRQDGFIKISVLDNGQGIEEEKLRKLFNPGEHITTSGTNQEKGTGLGLLICKEFIEKNGGAIQIESKVGEGSRFTFTLPAAG